MDDQLARKANLFRLGYPVSKIPITSMRLSAKDRFQQLKEIMRHEKSKDYPTEDIEDESVPVIPIIPTIARNDTGKKRPGYEALMSRPRHFSYGHYMNVKPNGEDIDDKLAATSPPQVIKF